MKRTFFLSLLFLFSLITYSQTPEESKAWEANMTPGEPHTWLASMNGHWDATVKMWMDPSQPPEISKATTHNEMILDGLYQRSQHTGTMMGRPFGGESMTGYDNFKKQFIATWVDNFGSSIMVLTGQYHPDKNTLVLHGSMADPASGQDMSVKEVLTITSKDSYKFEMFMLIGDQEIKNLEISYSRKK